MGRVFMSPKIVDKVQRRSEIASVALELFAEKGFQTVSVSRIAMACGIGKATLYEYFSTKDDLVYESIMVWMNRMISGVRSLLDTMEDPVEKLRTGVNTLTESFVSDADSVKLTINIFQTVMTDNEFVKKHDIVKEGFREMRKEVINILLDGISKGIFRPEIARDAEKIAVNLMAYLDGISLHYFMSKGYIKVMEQVNFYMDNLLRSIASDSCPYSS